MLRDNKAFQFIVGCVVLVFAYKIWSMGIFDAWWNNDPDAVEGASLAAMLGSAIVSSIQLIGCVAILMVAGLQPLAEQAMTGLASLVKQKKESTQSVDAEALNIALNDIIERLDKIEGGNGN